MNESLNYKFARRFLVYADESIAFRSLPLVARGIALYIGKLVDPVTGALPLFGREPWDAIRHASYGEANRSDRRALKSIVPTLIDSGYLSVGPVVDGEFLPVGHGGFLGVVDWVPSQARMERDQAAEWAALRDAKAEKWAIENLPDGLLAGSMNARDRHCSVLDSATNVPRSDHDRATTVQRPCNERRVSGEYSKGTILAPFRFVSLPNVTTPLYSPQGDSCISTAEASDGLGKAEPETQTSIADANAVPSEAPALRETPSDAPGEEEGAFVLSSDTGSKKSRQRRSQGARVIAWCREYFRWLDDRRHSLGLVDGPRRMKYDSQANQKLAKVMLRHGVGSDEAIRVSEWRQHGWHAVDADKDKLVQWMTGRTLLAWSKFEQAREAMPPDWKAPVSLCTWPETKRRGRDPDDVRYGIARPSPAEHFTDAIETPPLEQMKPMTDEELNEYMGW